jgi:Peptidase family M28
MKQLFIAALTIGMFFNLGAGHRGNDLYQVISSHPHDLEELTPHIETVYQNGRLWVVQLNENAPEEVLELLKPLSGHEKSYIHEGTWVSNIKIKNKKDNTKLIVSAVNKENIKKDVVELSNYESRYAGSEGNKKAVAATSERFSSMGYSVKEICYAPDACSLIAEKKGKIDASKVIMVMGHIDSVGEEFAGADDNASGVAVILEMARVLKDQANRKTIRFFVTNGEELGLYGATHYAKSLSSAELKNIDLAINMDMVGYNKSNNIVELETEPEHEPLAKWFADLASKFTSLKTKITLGAWGSDHVPFLKKGVPTMLTIENWDSKTPCYHQECDKPETLNYDYAAEIAKLNVSAVLTKDNQ